jgi:large subunit ribosomal protein L21
VLVVRFLENWLVRPDLGGRLGKMDYPMFAVIRTGGKQYRVAATDLVEIEKVAGEEGDAVAFGEVLVVGGDDGITLGNPLVAGATVAGEIVEHRRSATIRVFKKRRRQNSKRSRGHRQNHTLVRITEILTGGQSPKKARAKAAPAAKPAEAAPAPELAAAAAPAAAAKGDDLKRLSGVGPVMEKKLNALGVTTFAEIAAWSEDDIARIEEGLKAKGRVAREDWIGQAKKLAAGEE